MKLLLIGLAAVAVVSLVFLLLGRPGTVSAVVDKAAQQARLQDPDKLGWLDAAPLTEADRRRIAEITGTGLPDASNTGHLGVIRGMQSGRRGSITRRDFELLRQDRRRARAAYPEVEGDSLYRSAWFQVDSSARVPMEWNTSHNGDGTKGPDGKWYIDGGAYLSYVAPDYPNRASPAETAAFYAEQRAKRLAAKLARTEIVWGSGGTGGSLSCRCKDGLCVVTQADEWARKGKRYTFPFVAAEWVNDPMSMKQIEALPSFSQAMIDEIDVIPSGVSFGGAGRSDPNVPYSPGLTLGPGQSTTIGVSIPLRGGSHRE